MESPVQIARVQAYAMRCPIQTPVVTSFGVMRDRPAVFVRIEDSDGCFGWGEVFANWPAAGAEHRVNLLKADLGDLVLGFVAHAPDDLFQNLRGATRLRAWQCGEFGPFRQVDAGLDIAMWDLFARRSDVPLRRLLNQNEGVTCLSMPAAFTSARRIPKSTVPATQDTCSLRSRSDLICSPIIASVLDQSARMGTGERLAVDANQVWDLEAAKAFVDGVSTAQLAWLEEPLPAYAPHDAWQSLHAVAQMALAAGENIAGHAGFKNVLARGYLDVVQPDVMKWGGVTGCYAVACRVLESGARYCPHYLGGGIGLAASAELLAAVGGDGVLEVDINPNPLRQAFEVCQTSLTSAGWHFKGRPGLGIETLPDELGQYQTAYVEL